MPDPRRQAARLVALGIALDCAPRRAAWTSAIQRRSDGATADGAFQVVARWKLSLQAAIGDAAAGLDTFEELAEDGTERPEDQVAAYTMLLAEMPQRQHWMRAMQQRPGVDAGDLVEELNRVKMSLQARLGDAMEMQLRRGTNGSSTQPQPGRSAR